MMCWNHCRRRRTRHRHKGKKMQKITTFLTFNGTAEEAVKLYTSVFKNSRVISTQRYAADAPDRKKGEFMTAEIELDGQSFMVLNGGPSFQFSDGISLFVSCDSQQEIDDYCAKLTAGGGEQGACGWLKDRFGVSWQIVPRVLSELLGDKDPAKSQRTLQAMLQMKKLDIAALRRAYEGKAA